MNTRIPVFDDKSRRVAVDAIFNLDLAQPWDVQIERRKKKRTGSQNNLYWKWVGIIADDTGNDPDAVHDFLKNKFLIPTEITIAGEKLMWRTTTKLTTLGMKEYMDRVYAFAHADLNINLPTPEDVTV